MDPPIHGGLGLSAAHQNLTDKKHTSHEQSS